MPLSLSATCTHDVHLSQWYACYVYVTAHFPAGSWLHTPACKSAAFPEDSVADSHFRVWGWDDGRLCAFKDDQQRPTPINKKNNRLAWADAPACTQEPEPTLDNAVPDRMGCLWGWQLDRCSPALSAANAAVLSQLLETLPVLFSYVSCQPLVVCAAACEFTSSTARARMSPPSPASQQHSHQAPIMSCRNCAFKEQNTSEPKYIPGYNVTCTASLVASNM